MGLLKAECPLCARPIWVVAERSEAMIRCPNCGKSLVHTPTGWRAALAAQVEKPRTARPAAPMHAHATSPKADSRTATAGVMPPPMPSSRRFPGRFGMWLLAGGSGAVLLLVLSLVAVSVMMSVGSARPRNGEQEEGQSTAFVLPGSEPRVIGTAPFRGAPKPSGAAAARGPDRRSSGAVPQPRQSAVQKNEGLGGDPVKDALGSVAVVKSPDGHGSGFMAAPDCLVTNHHVIAMSRMADVRVGFPDNSLVRGRRFSAQLITEDPVNDIAVLRVECGVPPLRIDESYEHVNGEKVVAIGSPGTGGAGGDMLENLTTDGRLGPACTMPNGGPRWAMAMAINPGNSGGPIIDAVHGHVVGVAVAKFTKTESQALAVPHPVLLKALRAAQRASSVDRQRVEGLHRARFCLGHMVRVLQFSAISMDESCKAAKNAGLKTEAGMLDAFNECKSRVSRALSDELAGFETLVGAEVSVLENDNGCDVGIRAGVARLHASIEEQVADLRRSVPLDEIDDFLRDYRTSQDRARSLAVAVAKSLAVDIDEEAEE